MSQDVTDIQPGFPLFEKSEYQDTFARKRVFEEARSPEKIEEVFRWTTTEEYKELNFKRQVLSVNPNKVCQPAGAVLCALGFHKTLPYVHGSQGCVAYFRTYFNRHFREPIAAVSDSMTEDAAVFGGQNNIFEGLENARKMYEPEMMAVSTTCMAEIIGDDLNAFITNAKKNGRAPMDFPTPFANTPSFVGSHTNGWDNMLEGILRYFTLFQSAPADDGKRAVNEVPLIRLGFPLFDRHHLHRDTTLGYESAMYILKTLVNAVMERLDQETMIMGKTDYGFDLVR